MADKNVNIRVSTTGSNKSKKQLGVLTGSINGLGRAALNAGAAYFGARGLINAIKFSTESYGIQEQAEKKLEVALGKTSQALLDQASALQKVTTFGDEAIIGVQSSLAAFLDSEEAIKKATEATLDISVAMGMDLKSAGDLVAKTLGSSTNAMSRYGITVEGAVGSTDRLESLTGNVARLFGGQAKAQADTYAGSVQQLQNSLGDMAEDIGRIVIPIFEKLEPHLRVAIDFWSGYLDVGEKNEEQTTQYSSRIKELNELIKFNKDRIKELTVENVSSHGVTEDGINLAIRASEANRTIAEQLKHEKTLIGELIAEKFNLNNLHDKELEIREKLARKTEYNLKLRKAELDIEIDYVDVIEPTQKKIREQIELAGVLGSALSTAFDPDTGPGEAFKGFVIQFMSAMQGVILASKAVSQALTFTFTGPLGIQTAIASLVALEIAKAGVRSIKFAETGFDGIVNEPTMFVTGEAGAERVQVTPLQGPNINGPQGGITLNISAPLVDETVVESIIPAIQKAQRMNLA